MSDGIPPFDLPHEAVLASQVWLNALTWRSNPILLAAVRIRRSGEAGLVSGSVTHYLPRDRPGDDQLDRFMFDWPRHHGRAGDLVGAALMAAGANPRRKQLSLLDMLDTLHSMARRAPGWTDAEREALDEAGRILGPLRVGP